MWADRLVEKGMAVLDAERDRSGGDGGRSAEEGYLFDGWRVQVLNFLERVVGRKSAYFEQAAAVNGRFRELDARSLLGIITALREDVENGGLRRVERSGHDRFGRTLRKRRQCQAQRT